MASLTTPVSLLRLSSPAARSASSLGCRTPFQSRQFSSWRFKYSYMSKNNPGPINPLRENVTALLLCRRKTLNVNHINSSSSRGIWNSIHARYGALTLPKSLLDPSVSIEYGQSVTSRHLICCPLVSSFHVVNSHCSIYPTDTRPIPPANKAPSHHATLPRSKSHKPYHEAQLLKNSSTRSQTSKFSSSFSTPTRPGLAAECVYKHAASYGDRVAITDVDGDHTYAQLLTRSLFLSERLRAALPPRPGSQQHVALLVPNTAAYVVAQWAVWMTGHVVIPLCPQHPSRLLQYYLQDSSTAAVLCCPTLQHLLPPVPALQIVLLSKEFKRGDASSAEMQQASFGLAPATSRAMLLYTSGTTGDPKGVVLTHGCLQSQVQCLIPTWRYSGSDVLLHCLPLHHTHGVINVLMAPLSVGARVVMTSFRPDHVWSLLLGSSFTSPTSPLHTPNTTPLGEEKDSLLQTVERDISCDINFFNAVPTIYVKLLEYYEKTFAHSPQKSQFVKAVCQQRIRLMVCGSAALPVSVLNQWKEVTGHTLLERYGMTEIGMALTNLLLGDRKPGFVGTPFPGVRVRIVGEAEGGSGSSGRGRGGVQAKVLCEGDQYKTVVTPGCENMEGLLQVNGPNVFKEYWNKPEASKKEFTDDGWFKTGDTAVFTEDAFKILGRTSVDIIKSGGFKVSALGVERVMLEHPLVTDVVVVGAPDATWGQKICAVVVWSGQEPFNQQRLKAWLKDRLPAYQVPTEFLTLPELPRNNMGKVNKKQLLKDYFITKTSPV